MAMALAFKDGCSHYDAASVLQKWDSGSVTMSSTVRHSAGQSFLSPVLLRKNFSASAEFIVTGAFQLASIASNQSLVRLWDGVPAVPAIQLELFYITGLGIQVRRAGSTFIGAQGPNLSASTWYYYEFGGLIANSGGKVDVRIHDGSGTLVGSIASTGLDTQNTTTASADAIILNSAGNLFSDVHLWTGTGYSTADFDGDTKIITLRPEFAGASAQWAIGGTAPAGTNHQSQDETLADEATTYVSETGVGQRDIYEFTELDPTVATVHSVQMVAQWRKDDTATRGAKLTYRDTGGTNFDGSEVILPADWTMSTRVMETNPSGGGAWTRSAVNDGQFGEVLST